MSWLERFQELRAGVGDAGTRLPPRAQQAFREQVILPAARGE